MPTMSNPIPVVLVHGAWHGAWCWAGLQHALDELGVASFAIDLPGHGASVQPLCDLYGDAQHVAAVLAQIGTPAILVGHSYGGAVITEAASHFGDVAHLVYLTAFALEQGESIMSFLTSQPPAAVALSKAIVPRGDSSSVIDPLQAIASFYADCPPAVAAAAIARLSPQPMGTFTDAISGSPRAAIASTYVRCLRDESIHITHQDALAARCDAVHTLDSDHSPFASHIAETAAIIHALATA